MAVAVADPVSSSYTVRLVPSSASDSRIHPDVAGEVPEVARPLPAAGFVDARFSVVRNSVYPLEIAVQAGISGPVVKLSGESDLTTVGQLSDALNAQIASGARHLTIDLSGLRFADSATIRVFIEADRTLKDAGGSLELLHPQRVVTETLGLLGVDRLLTIRTKTGTGDLPAIP